MSDIVTDSEFFASGKMVRITTPISTPGIRFLTKPPGTMKYKISDPITITGTNRVKYHSALIKDKSCSFTKEAARIDTSTMKK